MACAKLVGFTVVLICNELLYVLRLPILQGGSFSYLPPALAILALPHNECPSDPINVNGSLLYNDTDGELIDGTEVWMRRMREVNVKTSSASSGVCGIACNSDYSSVCFI